MRVVVAHRTVDLALDGHVLQRGDLALDPGVEIGHLLAQCRRRRGLAVRTRQHRHRGMQRARVGAGRPATAAQQSAAGCHLRAAASARPCARIVDVFGRAGEMDEFGGRGELPARCAKRSFSQYSTALTSWLVRCLDGLDALAVSDTEILPTTASISPRAAAENGVMAGDGGLVGQRAQPCEFDADAVADEAVLGEMLAQRRHLAGIAAVERRQRDERIGGGCRCSAERLDGPDMTAKC